ncbi:MAG: hypothetical protein E7418_00160 [Ruminococcaceae bacterium]|nr:hypothetical protein [Oscillospiraceae bacterium]
MKTKRLVTTAMLIAIGTVLSIFQPLQLPFGGGITIGSMLPIIVIAYCYGTRWGLFSAFIFSLLQLLLGLKTVSAFFLPGESQMNLFAAILICLIDYILAYTVLGFGGIFKKRVKNGLTAMTLGACLAPLLRYILHIISGAVFFGSWAEWFFTQDGFYTIGSTIMNTFSGTGLALIYSIFYNGLYMVPEILITVLLAPIIYKTLAVSRKTNL